MKTSLFSKANSLFIIRKYLINNSHMNFSKVIAIPHSLKSKNPKPKKKESPTSKILLNEKLVDNDLYTVKNFELKQKHTEFIIESAKKLTMRFFKLKNSKLEVEFTKLQKFCKDTFNDNQINTIIKEIQLCKKGLDDHNIEKNESIFKLFLDRLYSKLDSNAGKYYLI